MHRSNPIGLVCGMLFLAALWVVFAWSHALSRQLQFWSTEAWLMAATVLGFFLWWHGMQLRNLVLGVPTSKIASAPQGYVELAGRAASAKRFFPGTEEFYLWRRTQIATRLRASALREFPFNLFYTVISVDVTENPFCIKDGSGTALIVPVGAEVKSAAGAKPSTTATEKSSGSTFSMTIRFMYWAISRRPDRTSTL
jgi:hypothetical protein